MLLLNYTNLTIATCFGVTFYLDTLHHVRLALDNRRPPLPIDTHCSQQRSRRLTRVMNYERCQTVGSQMIRRRSDETTSITDAATFSDVVQSLRIRCERTWSVEKDLCSVFELSDELCDLK